MAFGEGGIKERVKNILNFKKPAHIIILVAILLVAGLTLGLILNRSNEAKHIEKPLPIDKLTISTPRDSYTPFMSSMFGFELEVHAPPEAVKFEYTCDKGSFCTYEDGHIAQIGNNVTTDERVYWWAFEGKSYEYTAVVGTDNTTVTAAEYLHRSKLNGTISIGNTTITVTALNKEDREIAYGTALIENDATGDDKEWFRFKGIVYPSNSGINMEGDREDNGEGEFGRYFTVFTSGLEGLLVLLKINNLEELKTFTKDHPVQLSKEEELFQDYDNEFFAENIIYAYIESEGSGSVRLTAKKAEIHGDTLRLYMERISPEVGTCDMATRICLFGINREDVRNVKEVVGIVVNK